MATQTFQVRNDGSSDLSVTATGLAGADASEFSIAAGGGAFIVAPGDSHAVTVDFQPASVGAKSASLQVTSDDPDEPLVDVPLARRRGPAARC